ncbi:NAD(P)-dependent oxidoreductase [Candidatus Pacearchaeota archaeon]|jgi:dTDP-4-dehydrorhamnose reductase|nr:NAD(P)-dependent oxidoreductase [Candidatus Pacearchaeota archaeon]
MKIIVMGGNGFLGKELVRYFSAGNEVISASLHSSDGTISLDATNKDKVNDFISKYKPDIVIDTIALSNSVACEKNPEMCKEINYSTAKNIAEVCNENNIQMIFISSSYVFDGDRGNYSEKDIPNQRNAYAKTKVMAEKEISKLSNYLILRVEMMYGLDNGKIKFGTRTLDADLVEIGYPSQIRNPLFIEDVPKIISALIKKGQKGIFHVAGSDKISLLEFIKELSKLVSPSPQIKIVDSSKWFVESPKNPTLNISKINSLGIKTTSINNALDLLKKELNSL